MRNDWLVKTESGAQYLDVERRMDSDSRLYRIDDITLRVRFFRIGDFIRTFRTARTAVDKRTVNGKRVARFCDDVLRAAAAATDEAFEIVEERQKSKKKSSR